MTTIEPASLQGPIVFIRLEREFGIEPWLVSKLRSVTFVFVKHQDLRRILALRAIEEEQPRRRDEDSDEGHERDICKQTHER